MAESCAAVACCVAGGGFVLCEATSPCLTRCVPVTQSEPETMRGRPAAGGPGDGGPAAAPQPPAAAASH